MTSVLPNLVQVHKRFASVLQMNKLSSISKKLKKTVSKVVFIIYIKIYFTFSAITNFFDFASYCFMLIYVYFSLSIETVINMVLGYIN